ncbi:Gag-like protein [Panaeolus papilionaceus]|nr:Gag-like protein [Panaeolus papilionaceus]
MICNSKMATTATVYFDLWDSQNGAQAKQLIGTSMMICGHSCLIQTATPNRRVPCCQRCFRWGHDSLHCRAKIPMCPICGGPHLRDHHHAMVGCCKGNENANPPGGLTSTPPADQDCPHQFPCLNCGKEHSVDSCKCAFWHNRYNDTYYVKMYQKVSSRYGHTSKPANPHSQK